MSSLPSPNDLRKRQPYFGFVWCLSWSPIKSNLINSKPESEQPGAVGDRFRKNRVHEIRNNIQHNDFKSL